MRHAVRTIDIDTLLTRVRARKRQLGIADSSDAPLRNDGTRRTAAKRELLRRTAARAHAAGRDALPSRY